MAILEGHNLTMRFGGLVALKNVTFTITSNELVALLGPNGSGKTTLFDLISGHLTPSEGTIRFHGETITGRSPHRIARLGLGRTYQIPRPFPALTVRDNVAVGALFRGASHSPTRILAQREAEKFLEIVGLPDKAGALASTLSLGDLKRLELALALATRPALLLLDELAAGLSPRGREEVISLYGKLRARGLTIVAIEHDFRTLTRVADRILVLDQGALIADGPPEVVLTSRRVAEAYLGENDT